jgi:hypothetical protein
MTTEMEAYVGLLIQIPLVGIFVWFSLQLIATFLKAIEQRDQAWREFLAQQRTFDREAIAHMAQRFSDEIKTLAGEVAEFRGRNE